MAAGCSSGLSGWGVPTAPECGVSAQAGAAGRVRHGASLRACVCVRARTPVTLLLHVLGRGPVPQVTGSACACAGGNRIVAPSTEGLNYFKKPTRKPQDVGFISVVRFVAVSPTLLRPPYPVLFISFVPKSRVLMPSWVSPFKQPEHFLASMSPRGRGPPRRVQGSVETAAEEPPRPSCLLPSSAHVSFVTRKIVQRSQGEMLEKARGALWTSCLLFLS